MDHSIIGLISSVWMTNISVNDIDKIQMDGQYCFHLRNPEREAERISANNIFFGNTPVGKLLVLDE